MEVVIGCYFDQVFSSLARGSLYSRDKRQELIETFTTIIETCSVRGSCSRQDGCRHAVRAAIRYHRRTKADNGKVCLMGKYHNVLYVGVRLCFDFRLEDTDTVAILLQDIYSCENTFERIFAGAIFGGRVSHFVAGWKSDFKNQNENIAALAYFLKHATKSKLQFKVSRSSGHELLRFSDVPMTSISSSAPIKTAAQLPKPEVVLILLRFGSAVEFDKENVNDAEPILQWSQSRVCYPEKSAECLQYLLRAVPSVRDLAHSQEFGDILNGTVHSSPPRLKHLCRCTIRSCLGRNWQLPFGIQQLEMPKILVDYLDLLTD